MIPAQIIWDVDPVFFKIGSLSVAYYGFMWVLAFVVGAILFRMVVKREGYNLEMVDSALIILIVCTMVGSRLGHCFFYEPAKYLAEPWKIITGIRDGGMASHGAAIGLLIGIWIWARKWKMPYVWMLDRIGIMVAIGGVLIRFGNLLNSEVYGGETDLPWGFVFVRKGETVAKHPTQIYEMIAYTITFLTVAHLYWRTKLSDRRGLLFGVFLVMLFGTRFLIESIKEVQVGFEEGWILNMGQILSIPFIIAGIYFIVRGIKNPPKSYVIHASRSRDNKKKPSGK